MTWHVEFTKTAEKEIKKLDRAIEKRIRVYLRERVLRYENPRGFGKELAGKLEGLFKYRIGDYRVLCEIHDEILLVLVVRVAHRKEAYE